MQVQYGNFVKGMEELIKKRSYQTDVYMFEIHVYIAVLHNYEMTSLLQYPRAIMNSL